MKLHPEDLEWARRRWAGEPTFPSIRSWQLAAIHREAKRFRRWVARHPLAHNAITLVLFLFLFASDAWALHGLPRIWTFVPLSWGALVAGAVAGGLHGFLVCGITTLSVHEGAAHDLLVSGQGAWARRLRTLTSGACRLFFADPEHYAAAHLAHHRHLGDEGDGSFTNHVRWARLASSLAPLAPLRDASDYFPWRPQEATRSRRLSLLLGSAVMVGHGAVLVVTQGPLYAAVSVCLIGGWLGYALDRVRESTEHLDMPLDPVNGTRELGLGAAGLILGGGPWGQPCHLTHHLAPGLPWYLQLRLHFTVRKVLDEEQRRALFLRPVVGFPALLVRLRRS